MAQRGTVITPRQREILVLIAGGMPNKVIAKKLGVTQQTVKNHRQDLYRRLGGNNGCHAVMRALASGIIRITEIELWNLPVQQKNDIEY